jgi:hypothetical protein
MPDSFPLFVATLLLWTPIAAAWFRPAWVLQPPEGTAFGDDDHRLHATLRVAVVVNLAWIPLALTWAGKGPLG